MCHVSCVYDGFRSDVDMRDKPGLDLILNSQVQYSAVDAAAAAAAAG